MITAPMVALMISRTQPHAEADAQLRQQPARQQRADDADHDVADQPEACAAHDQPGKPARNRANDQCRYDAH